MFRVLIVDDEISIREGLTDIIDWAEYGMEICGQASNGREALELAVKLKPNVIITDIRMPYMDGLELVRAVSRLEIGSRILVLSGYDDFRYVKEAMKCGVENYLLKPIDQDELVMSVKKIYEELEKGSLSDIQKREGMEALKNNIMGRIVKNDISLKEYREKAEFLDINLNCTKLQVAVVEPCFQEALEKAKDKQESSKKGNEEFEWGNFAVMGICREIIEENDAGIVFQDDRDNTVVIFNNLKKDFSQDQVKDCLQHCQKRLKEYLKLDSFACIGETVISYRKLNISYEQALRGLEYKMVSGISRLVFYQKIQQSGIYNTGNFQIKHEIIKSCLENGNKSELIDYINGIYEELLIKRDISPEWIRSVSIEIVLSMYHVVKELKGDIQDIPGSGMLRTIWKTDNLESLKNGIIAIICSSSDHISSLVNRKYSRLTGEAVNYLKKNYNKPDISLKTLSNHLNATAIHLGRTFKNETGEFFSDYLNKIRVEKAKEFIFHSNLKINEISEKVGFLNTNYFYTLFKKYTGSNPGELRKKQYNF